jgi:hypothetical protein
MPKVQKAFVNKKSSKNLIRRIQEGEQGTHAGYEKIKG